MSKEVQAQNWHAETHAHIHDLAQTFDASRPNDAAKPLTQNGGDMKDEVTVVGRAVQDLLGTDWRGEAATAMQSACSKLFQEIDDYGTKIQTFGNQLPALVSPIEAAKRIPPPRAVSDVAKDYSSKGYDDKTANSKAAQDVSNEQEAARTTMTNQFSEPVVGTGHNASMDDATGTGPGTGTGTGTGTGSNNGGSNNASGQKDQGQDGQTKPAFNDGSSNQNGQGQGQGQGQGGGSGSGSGGQGAGSGSGSGAGSSPFGSGANARDAGYAPYSPTYTPGQTTAAGYSPGTATGTSAPGALRPGLGGIPGPGAGTGTNPAGVGASGIRGGAGGFGGMGMAGMGGAHARGQGEEEEDHEIPAILINLDNGNELYGDLPKASPGVIGDWTEQERAEKQRNEAEKRRYKSLGWDVKFE